MNARFTRRLLVTLFLGANALFLSASGLSLTGCGTPRATLPPAPPPRPAADYAAWREPPRAAPDPELHLPWKIVHSSLSNGVGLTVVERAETRATSLLLRVPGMRDSSWGPVTVMADALRAGTRHGKEIWVDPRLGLVPIRIVTERLGTTFAWQVLPRASERALRMLAAFVLQPAFDLEELKLQLPRELSHIQAASMQLQGHLASLAKSKFPGLEHPSFEQDALQLPKETPALLRTIHRCTAQPAGAEIVVVGPVDASLISSWAEAAFGAWRAAPATPADCDRWQKPPAPAHPEATRLDRPELQIVYSGQHDPLVIVTLPGPAVESPDFLPYALLGQVLKERDAGTAQALRDSGTTYGIHSEVDAGYAGFSLLTLSGFVEPYNARRTIEELLADVGGIATRLEQAELEVVQRRWRNEIIAGFAANDAVAGRVLWQLQRGRDVRELPTFPNEINAVDVARCREVAERWLSHAVPSIAVSGLPEKIASGLNIGAHLQEFYWDDDPNSRRRRVH